MKPSHCYDILNALSIAWDDTSRASTKRSYTAAKKAFKRMHEEHANLKKQNKAVKRELKRLWHELIQNDIENWKALDIVEKALKS